MLLFEKNKKKAKNRNVTSARLFITRACYISIKRKFSSFFIGFHPLACIDKCFYPRSDLVAVYAVCGVATVLPGKMARSKWGIMAR